MESDLIGEYAFNNTLKTIPAEVRERTRLAVLNFLSVAIGANSYKDASKIVEACVALQSGDNPIFGSGKKSGLLSSAWANSALSHLLDFDDTHLETIVHPSAPVISSSLSLAINNGENGKDLLYSSAIGMEVAIRLAQGVGLDELYSDWHNTSLYGTSAASVAASIMLHSSAEQIGSSMLEGLTVATGFLSNRGTTSKSFQVGRAAAEGIASAIAINKGITVSKNMVNTFAKSLSGKFNLTLITKDFGKKWNVLDNYLKPYPCGVVLHPGIDAAVKIHYMKIAVSDIEEITVKVNPIVMVLTAILEPKTGLEGKFSVTHTISAAILHGPLFPEHFSDSSVNDPEVLSLRKKIKIVESESINRGQTIIEVKLKGGAIETSEINRGPSTPSKLLNSQDVEFKFNHLCRPVMGEDRANEVWKFFSSIESKKDLSEIKELFR
jgi:2-methylcitrate dehydratase PrpD